MSDRHSNSIDRHKGLRFQHLMSMEESRKYELMLARRLRDNFPKMTDKQIDKLIDTESHMPSIIHSLIQLCGIDLSDISKRLERLELKLDSMKKGRI